MYACRAIAPGDRACVAVPVIATDDIVAVGKRHCAAVAHLIIGLAADQRVGGRDGARYARGLVAPGGGAAVAVPVTAADDIVAVGECRNAEAAHQIPRVRTDQGVGGVDRAGDPGGAVAPG